MAQGYERVALDDSRHGGEGSSFEVDVLIQQNRLKVSGISGSMAVVDLKELIAAEEGGYPIDRQRLICKGRELKPDAAKLDSFGIRQGAILHCFPRPPPSVVAELVRSGPSAVAAAALPTAAAESARDDPYGQTNLRRLRQQSMWADHQMQDSARDVRMWCLILLFLSATSTFDICAYFLTNGSFGKGGFDNLTQLVHLICSVAGLYVSQLGLTSVRTTNPSDTKRYVISLTLLLFANAVYQVLSAYDLIFQVEKAYDDQEAAKAEESEGNESGVADDTQNPDENDNVENDDMNVLVDDFDQQKLELTPELIDDFKYQLWVFVVIVLLCWVTCLARAVRFHVLVRRLSEPPDSPTISAAVEASAPAAIDTAGAASVASPLHAGDIEMGYVRAPTSADADDSALVAVPAEVSIVPAPIEAVDVRVEVAATADAETEAERGALVTVDRPTLTTDSFV